MINAGSPLLERDDELAELQMAWNRARAGRGSVVILRGPGGIGKTAVIDAFRERCEGTVLVANGSPIVQRAPGGVPREWFGRMLRTVGAGNRPFDGPAEQLADDDFDSLDLAFAVRWVIDDLTMKGPVLLIVDDVHWIDLGSLALLERLAASLSSSACLLVLGLRTGERAGDPELMERISRNALTLNVLPLSRQAIDELVSDLPDEVRDQVADRSGGNPLFVNGLADGHRAGLGTTPRGLLDVLAGQIERMSHDAIRAVTAVAILGANANRDRLAELAGLPRSDVADQLRDLEYAGLVAIDGERVAPSHPLLVEAALSRLSEAELARLNENAAGILTRSGVAEDIVAGHWLAAEPADRQEVRDLFVRVARKAIAVEAPALAATYMRRAVREGGDADLELLQVAAKALANDGDVDEAIRLWHRAAGLTDDPVMTVLIEAEAGDALLSAGRYEEAEALWIGLLEGLGTTPMDGELRKALIARLTMIDSLTKGTPRDDFLDSVQRTLAQPREHDSRGDRLLLAAGATALVFTRSETAETARDWARRAWADGVLLEEETAAGSPLYLISGVLDWTDDFDTALNVLDAVVDAAHASGSSSAVATAAYCRGYVHARHGTLRKALADLTLADSLRQFGWNAYTPLLLHILVEVHLARGERETAHRLAPMLSVMTDHTELVFGAYASYAMADLAVDAGRIDQALDYLDRVAGRLEHVADNPAMLPWRGKRALLLHSRDERRAAQNLAQENLQIVREWGGPRTVAEALCISARVAGPGERAEYWEEALALTEPLSLRRTKERLAALVGLASLTDDEESAVEWATEAYEQAREEGVVAVVQQASAVLKGKGVVLNEERSPEEMLSPAERRVAELVVGGMTNREAAGQLFVTVKAVEWHLSSIYKKLDISSRKQLSEVLPELTANAGVR